MLETGTKAPDFELPDQNGNMHKLSDYAGKKVILYFYALLEGIISDILKNFIGRIYYKIDIGMR